MASQRAPTRRLAAMLPSEFLPGGVIELLFELVYLVGLRGVRHRAKDCHVNASRAKRDGGQYDGDANHFLIFFAIFSPDLPTT